MLKKKEQIILVSIILLVVTLTPFLSSTQTYLNESNQWQQNLTAVYWSSSVFGDLNDDGFSDLVTIGYSTSYSSKVYINNGTTLTENSIWQSNLTQVQEGSLALGDIDNDGNLDLVLSGCSNGGGGGLTCNAEGHTSKIYLNNGTSFIESSQWQSNLTQLSYSSVILGDIDNDGKLDLMITGRDSGNSKRTLIYLNNDTSFIESSQWQNNLVGVTGSCASLGDIDNDGDLDLGLCGDITAVPYQTTKIYLNNGTSFIEDSTWKGDLANVGDCQLSFSDFDNDGDLDINLIGCCDKHISYRNNGSTFTQFQTYTVVGGPFVGIYDGSISIGDYDNDGDLDIASSGNEKYTTIYLNNGSGSYTDSTSDPESDILNLWYDPSIIWIDLDNDTDLDLFLIGHDGSNAQAKIYISNASLTKNNTKPNPTTTSFSSSYSDGVLKLGWGNGSDTETNTSGLYYNLMVGNASTNHTIVSGVFGGSSNPTAGYFGNMMQRKNISLNKYLSAGTYNWYVQTIDTGLAKSNWSAVQSIVVGGDITAPVISSVSSSVTSSTATITWTTDETSNSSILYGTTTALGSSSGSASLVSSHSISLSSLSASTLYYYNVSSCDYWENCNTSIQYEFTTSATPVTPPGGGGSSGGSSTISFWSQTYTASDADFKKGVEKELFAKQRVEVNIDGGKHYVGIVDLSSTTAMINITSKPIQIVLGIGQDAKVDVLNDGWYDVYVKLNSILNNKANVTIQSIHEEIPIDAGKVETEGEIVGEEDEEEKEVEKEKKYWIYGVIVVSVLVLIFIISKFAKEHKRRREWKKWTFVGEW